MTHTSAVGTGSGDNGTLSLFSRDKPSFWQRTGYLQTYLDFLLREISPGFSRKVMMAKVVRIVAETADTKTYILKPPLRWAGFRPGQHLPVAIEINGGWTRRTYTISSTPEQFHREGTIAITVKKMPGGRVSNALFSQLKPGHWLQIGDAFGEFTLERATQDDLLFIAAGSGITPVLALLQAHRDMLATRNATLMYYCRHRNDVIFAKKLARLADDFPRFTLVTVLTHHQGRISPAQLLRHCPDVAERDVFLCGPTGFMSAASGYLTSMNVPENRIFHESFGGVLNPAPTGELSGKAEVTFTRTGLRVTGDGRRSLLELAEFGGLMPKQGCRSGICHQCKCTKLSGTVVDARTGKPSGPEQADIQICISIPQGPVEIAL